MRQRWFRRLSPSDSNQDRNRSRGCHDDTHTHTDAGLHRHEDAYPAANFDAACTYGDDRTDRHPYVDADPRGDRDANRTAGNANGRCDGNPHATGANPDGNGDGNPHRTRTNPDTYSHQRVLGTALPRGLGRTSSV